VGLRKVWRKEAEGGRGTKGEGGEQMVQVPHEPKRRRSEAYNCGTVLARQHTNKKMKNLCCLGGMHLLRTD